MWPMGFMLEITILTSIPVLTDLILLYLFLFINNCLFHKNSIPVRHNVNLQNTYSIKIPKFKKQIWVSTNHRTLKIHLKPLPSLVFDNCSKIIFCNLLLNNHQQLFNCFHMKHDYIIDLFFNQKHIVPFYLNVY